MYGTALGNWYQCAVLTINTTNFVFWISSPAVGSWQYSGGGVGDFDLMVNVQGVGVWSCGGSGHGQPVGLGVVGVAP